MYICVSTPQDNVSNVCFFGIKKPFLAAKAEVLENSPAKRCEAPSDVNVGLDSPQ